MMNGGRVVRKAKRRKKSTGPKMKGTLEKGTILKYMIKPLILRDTLDEVIGVAKKIKSEDVVEVGRRMESDQKRQELMSDDVPNLTGMWPKSLSWLEPVGGENDWVDNSLGI